MKSTGGNIKRTYITNQSYLRGVAAVIEFGYYLPPRSNLTHTHWRTQVKVAKEHRLLGAGLTTAVYQDYKGELDWPHILNAGDKWSVRMVRLAKCPFDDDNLEGAFKSIRDGIADGLGTTDKWRGNIKWEYDQDKSKEYGIRIELTRLSGA